MGLSCSVSKIDGDFSRKSHIFPTSTPLRGSPGNLVTPDGLKKLEWWGYQNKSDIFSRLDTIYERDGQTPANNTYA